MKRLIIYCEGQTEEMFVERLLRNHLAMHGVKVERAILAATSLDPDGQRGGFVNWTAIEADLHTEFSTDDDLNLRFSTLLDVYRIPPGIPGYPKGSSPLGTSDEVAAVEREIEKAFNEPRFTAYLQRHEFEALVLANPAALLSVFHECDTSLRQLEKEIAEFANAEEINHGQNTHPSARLEAAIPGYSNLKASRAYWVLAEAGLADVRKKCPRFDAWLKHWENWGDS